MTIQPHPIKINLNKVHALINVKLVLQKLLIALKTVKSVKMDQMTMLVLKIFIPLVMLNVVTA
jgi:hypothetical protein